MKTDPINVTFGQGDPRNQSLTVPPAESATPEVDALYQDCLSTELRAKAYWPLQKLARTLERQRDDTRASRDTAIAAANKMREALEVHQRRISILFSRFASEFDTVLYHIILSEIGNVQNLIDTHTLSESPGTIKEVTEGFDAIRSENNALNIDERIAQDQRVKERFATGTIMGGEGAQCCHGIGGRIGVRCTNAATWVSTFHGNDCAGTQGPLAWCSQHKPHTSTPPHGLRPLMKEKSE